MVLVLIMIICGALFCLSIYGMCLSFDNALHPMKMPIVDGVSLISFASVRHLGGNPNIRQNSLMNFELNNKGIFRMRVMREYIVIDPKDIIKCEFKTEQQIRHEVTAGGLIMFGALAFASKKEKKTISSYMILKYKLNNVPINCLFEAENGQKLSQLVYKINEIMINDIEIAIAE